MGLENDVNTTKGESGNINDVFLNTDNSIDSIKHPWFEYLMGAVLIGGTAAGAYIGHTAGNAYAGAMISFFISGFGVNAAIEDRYERESLMRSQRRMNKKNNSNGYSA